MWLGLITGCLISTEIMRAMMQKLKFSYLFNNESSSSASIYKTFHSLLAYNHTVSYKLRVHFRAVLTSRTHSDRHLCKKEGNCVLKAGLRYATLGNAILYLMVTAMSVMLPGTTNSYSYEMKHSKIQDLNS